MKKQTINIHHEAAINAIGKYNSGHCKPVVCLETGAIYSSVMDAASTENVSYAFLVNHLNGKVKSAKGKHYRYLSDVLDNPDIMFANQRKYYAQVVADADDARKWREYQAEQEAIRIAKEKHDAEIAKAESDVKKLEKECDDLEAALTKKIEQLMAAQDKLDELKNADA